MSTATLPLVSVVTPVYNGADYLVECIESVLGQTYENWECVVVDNCSTDRTLEIARSFEARDPRIRAVAPDVFVGAVANANRALRQMSPESRYCKVLHDVLGQRPALWRQREHAVAGRAAVDGFEGGRDHVDAKHHSWAAAVRRIID